MKPFAVLLTVLLCASGSVHAHEARPGFLELREVAPNRFEMLWKQPALRELRLRINPDFPAECMLEGMGDQQMLPGALLWRTTLVCDGGISGKSIAVVGLEATLTDVLVRVHHANGVAETHLLKPASPSATIGGQSQGPGAYVTLGVEHIVLGIDHLLFVLGLLLIVKDRWMLLKTITSFTLAHSITLAIATLGYATAPVLPLNAAIALSILFLGPEIVRSWRGEMSFTIRHPWVVAFAFGLLHGFGFASGLTAMGLPRAEIPLALLLFNVGVEIGQLLFVLLVLLMERSFRTLEIQWPRWAELVPGYVVGTLGAFWAIQRSAMLFGGAP